MAQIQKPRAIAGSFLTGPRWMWSFPATDAGRDRGRVSPAAAGRKMSFVLEAALDVGRGGVALELDVGHDRVGVKDGREDDGQGQGRRRRGEDPPDLGGDPVLEGREAVPLRLGRLGQQVEGDLVAGRPSCVMAELPSRA